MPKPTNATPGVAAHEVRGPKYIEIFRAGKHVDANGQVAEFTNADIADIAESYDPGASEAPIVVGHPKNDAPAYGWVKSLKADGPLLLAEPHQVDGDFANLVNTGRFKKRSAALLSPSAPNHPKPGHWYLRHVGFLGGAAPAVKGLRDVVFNDGGEGVHEFTEKDTLWGFGSIAELMSRLRDYLIDKEGLETADKVIADWQIDHIRNAARPASDAASLSYGDVLSPDTLDDNDMTNRTEELAARETALATQAEQLAAREAAIAQREGETRRLELVSFADGLISAGRLLPRFKAPVIELLVALAPGQKLIFADGDGQVERDSQEFVRELLSSMPVQVNFTERAGDALELQGFDFAAPAGSVVDPSKAEIYTKAKAHQAANPNLSWVACVHAVGG